MKSLAIIALYSVGLFFAYVMCYFMVAFIVMVVNIKNIEDVPIGIVMVWGAIFSVAYAIVLYFRREKK